MSRFFISLGNSAANVLLLVALTRLLPPAWFGELSYARGWVAVCYALGFDWLRLSITRYWAGRSPEQAQRRATLSVLMGFMLAAVVPLAGIAVFAGRDALGSAVVLAIACNIGLQGYNELRVAIARSECDDRGLAMLMLPRAGLTLVLGIVAAFAGFGPVGILVALAAAQCGGLAFLAFSRRPLHLRAGLPDAAMTRLFMRFGGFVVISNSAMSVTMLALATIMVAHHGAAAYAPYAVASDLTLRMTGVVGLAMEIALLPIAIAALTDRGRDAARAVLGRNGALTVAVIGPMLLGFWLVAPAFAQTVLGAEYREGFVALAGIVVLQYAFTSAQLFVLNQAMFVAERTAPSTACVVAGSLLAVVLGALLIPEHGALGVALAQLAGAATTFLLQSAVVAAVFPAAPSLRSLATIVGGCLAMAVAVWPLRSLGRDATTLVAMVAGGATTYGLVLWAADFEGARTMLLQKWAARKRGTAVVQAGEAP